MLNRRRKLVAASAAIVAIGTAGVMGVSASRAAFGAQVVNGHISDTGCGAGPDLTGGPFLVTTDMVALVSRGGYVLTCQFEYPTGSFPASVIRVTGFVCAIWPDVDTYDSLFIASPGGRATLSCRLGTAG